MFNINTKDIEPKIGDVRQNYYTKRPSKELL